MKTDSGNDIRTRIHAMTRPFDLTKLKKFSDKSTQMSYGFNDPKTWIDTGCYALNYQVSNRFRGGIPLEGKITMFAGDSGSGKSFLATANVIRWCQNNNVYPVLIDTENALDESWLEKLGVKTDEESMAKWLAATVDDVSQFIGELIENYKDSNKDFSYKEKGKMVIIIDSLGMLITPTQEKQFMEGDQRGDMGIKAKQVTAMLRVLMSKIASLPIGIIITNHVYNSQDKYTPDQIAGGMMVEFSTSLLIQMNKYVLKKEEQEGKESKDGKDIVGIKTSTVVRKSRYAKPFERVWINIPYSQGMDPYSGLFELLEKKGCFEKAGSWYTYVSPETGEETKHQGSSVAKWKEVMDHIMDIWETHYELPEKTALGFDETGATEECIDEEIAAMESQIEEIMAGKKGKNKK